MSDRRTSVGGGAGRDAALCRVLEGTARTTGDEFFRALVRNLALVLETSHAWIAELAPDRRSVHTLAAWGGGRFLDDFAYDLEGGPCAEVVAGRACHHPGGVRERFPRVELLARFGAESYLGAPLEDDRGDVLGLVVLLGTRPDDESALGPSILDLCAARAAAELQRVRAQAALAESERRLRDLFDEAPIGYVYEDTQTRFLAANRAAQQMLGLRPEEVTRTVGMSLVAPTREAQDRVNDSLKAEQAGQQKPFIELELRRKDNGRPVWVQRFSRPEPDGKYTRTMIVDVTEKVLAERERARLKEQNTYLREEIEGHYNHDEIVGAAGGLRETLALVRQVAPTDSTVLILGETGSGKELIARALHSGSRRHARPLIKLNCAALPSGLIESELFGHEKGAFTGALEKRLGRFALADGGTIFLDEIGEVSPEVQVRLLRVLQERQFEAIGSHVTTEVDVRVIAATNRDLPRAVQEGEFRADLFYRLNVFPIRVPALRERRDDIPLLAHYFAARHAARNGKVVDSIDDETMQRLVAYGWPGNVRELENVVERAVILCSGSVLRIDAALLGPTPRLVEAGDRSTLTAAENARQHLVEALDRSNWRIEGENGAARRLGLHPNTLRSRMKKLGIRRSHETS